MNSPLDPDLSLDPAAHFFYQHDKAHTWKPATGTGLNMMLASGHPALYRTILASSDAYDESKPTLYAGPFYLDLDVSPEMGGIETAIVQAARLLDNLAALVVDRESVRIFATGGRGFHLEVPSGIFAPGLAPSPDLPAIYRRMAESVYVDGVDLAVYSARKGRMWRVPNRQRESGKYKVPVSLEQVHCMTVADYDRLTACSQPWPRLHAPTYAPGLALEFAKARDAVSARAKPKAQASKESAALKARFGGNFPPSLLGLLQGRFQSEQGWNRVALQVALAAHAVGLSESALIEQARPLIDGHQGDGNRYGTVKAREDELRHQFSYTLEAGYQFSIGGLKSILPPGVNTRDLRGLS
jgi:hypothetical protein